MLYTYLNIIWIIMKRLKGSGRDMPNKRLSIHLRTILPVHDLTVAASTVGRRTLVYDSVRFFSPTARRDAPAARSACTRARI